jgi:hypothetical protein
VTGQLDGGKLQSYCDVLDEIERIAVQRSDYQELRSSLADYLWWHAYWLYSHSAHQQALQTLYKAKRHDDCVTKRNGPMLSRILGYWGLDALSGPLLYWLFRAKVRLLGAPTRIASGHVDALADAHPI